MHPYVLAPLLSCVVSAILASAIITRDPGLRVNRLTGMLLVCTAWWSLCEVLWNTAADAEGAAFWLRLSCVGWMSLGPLSFHIFVELVGDRRKPFHRMLPYSYAATAGAVLMYIATPWCLTSVFQKDWGWAYVSGPLFPLAYAAAAAPPILVLLNWRHVSQRHTSGGERRVSRAVFVGVAVAVAVASTTDVLLPILGYYVPRLATASITAVAVMVAWYLNRFGYSLLSPSAFAQEILATLHDGVAVLDPGRRILDANGALERIANVGTGGLRGVHVDELLCEPVLRGARGVESALVVDGETRIPVVVSSSVLEDERGRSLGEALVVCDLREVVALRQRLVTSGRLAAVGELSAGIAQEINRPVHQVRDRVRALRRSWAEIEKRTADIEVGEELAALFGEGEEVIDECIEGVERVAAIVRDVGGFASRRGLREPVDLNGLVDDALRLAQPRAAAGVSLERTFDVLPPVSCCPQEIVQVVLNLVLNALDAVEDGGRVEARTERSDGEVLIHVRDDGAGIPTEVRERVFDPFFTTKPVGVGTGLGLSISYHIVRSHGGEIRVDSEPGRGTTFTVTLPSTGAHPS